MLNNDRSVGPEKSVLIVSHDVIGERMAGPGIRYYHLARVLSRDFRVTLAAPGAVNLPDTLLGLFQLEQTTHDIDTWPYEPQDWDSLAPAAAQADVVLTCGDVLAAFPALRALEAMLVVDGYDPHPIETLALFDGKPEQRQRHRERERVLALQCQAGDFFICASERQRDWWLGLLEASGRINSHTYGEDPSLRQLIDVVPYGLPASPPRHTRQVIKGVWPGIGPEDKVILWGGGLWQWLDPLTAIRAIAQVAERRPDVRLIFPGTRHPNAVVPDMPMYQTAQQLAETLGVLNHHVFFGDWIAYENWPNCLLESDVALSLHFDTLETRLAFRSRVLDYIWAGVPIVASRGDATGELVAAYELGHLVGYEKVAEVRDAILALLDELDKDNAHRLEKFAEARSRLTWEEVARPLFNVCQAPQRAADRRMQLGNLKADVASEASLQLVGLKELQRQVDALEWYHTLDLGQGVITPGIFDHRPYLHYYGIPDDLTGKTVLDVGAASGFFAFEMERRGAQVTALDLPAWLAHDFGPLHPLDKTPEEAEHYLRDPIMLAKRALGSKIDKVEMTVYDISPDTVGMFDLVFCGSVLLHLTDPIRALWRLRDVTREQVLVATTIYTGPENDPVAMFAGQEYGNAWWLPNRACLELMVQTAGFTGYEWVSEFRLDYRDGTPGPAHGVIRAWVTPNRPEVPDVEYAPLPRQDTHQALETQLTERDAEIERLRALVTGYEQGRVMRLMRWFQRLRTALTTPGRRT